MTKGITSSWAECCAAGTYVNRIVGALVTRAICKPHANVLTVVLKRQIAYDEVVACIDRRLNIAGEIVAGRVRELLALYYPAFVQTPDLVVFHTPHGFVVVDVKDNICFVHVINN